jgi:hypothetical protein
MAAYELYDSILYNDANIVAYYRTNTGALTTDSKGSNTLTNLNAVAEGTGMFGKSADFGSPNTTKTLYRDARITTNTSNFTICGWVYCASINQFGEFFFNGGPGGSSTNGWGLYISKAATPGSTGSRLFALDGAIAWYETTFDFTVNTWTHIALTNNGTLTKVYANGVEKYSGNPAAFGAPSNICSIGSGYCGATNTDFFSGMVDDVAVFTRALTGTEVTSLYDGTIARRSTGGATGFMTTNKGWW